MIHEKEKQNNEEHGFRYPLPGFKDQLYHYLTRHSLCPFFLVLKNILQFSTVQLLNHVQIFVTPWTAACTAPCLSPTLGVYSNSYPLSQWCFPTSSSSVGPFSSHLQSFPVSGPFPMSQFFPSGGQSIVVSASASVLPMNMQDWFPLGLTGLISLKSKGLSKVFFNIILQKHQFFGAQLSL